MEVIMEYQHGGDIYSQDIQMDYSANINPLGMPEAVRQALRIGGLSFLCITLLRRSRIGRAIT